MGDGVEEKPAAIRNEAERALRCFEGDPLRRDQAERMLSMWARRDELSDDDWDAILDRFPLPEGTENAAADDEIEDVRAVLQRLAARLWATGNTQIYSLGIQEGLRRAASAARDRDEQRYADGFVDALTATLDPEPVALHYYAGPDDEMTDHQRALEYREYLHRTWVQHAWVVRAHAAPGAFKWTCSCGEVVVQEVAEPDIRAKLLAHVGGEANR